MQWWEWVLGGGHPLLTQMYDGSFSHRKDYTKRILEWLGVLLRCLSEEELGRLLDRPDARASQIHRAGAEEEEEVSLPGG